MMDIDKLEAGPELDALVAEKVMGCNVGRHRSFNGQTYLSCECDDRRHEDPLTYAERALPDYSTDIAAAWQVVEHLQRSLRKLGSRGGYKPLVLRVYRNDSGAYYRVSFHMRPKRLLYASTYSQSLPLAICRAALKAVAEPKLAD